MKTNIKKEIHTTQNQKPKFTSKTLIKEKKIDPGKAMWDKVCKSTSEFILCWLSTPGHGTCPEVWLIWPVRLSCRRLHFPFSGVPVVDCFLVRAGSSISFFLSTLGTSLAWPCVGLVSLYVKQSSYVWNTTFSGAIYLPWLLQSLQLLFLIAPLAPRGRVWWRNPT